VRPAQPNPMRVIQRGRWTLRIIRSPNRHKTVSAEVIDATTLEICAPLHATETDILGAVDVLIARTERHIAKRKTHEEEAFLEERAHILNDHYFGGKLQWHSLRFVSNQRQRFGSCTPDQGTIRISDRLRHAPRFVLDYVLMHELAHLIEPNHSRTFWKLVNQFPKAERARGYLMAMQQFQKEQEKGQ